MQKPFNTIFVVGAGFMGSGIAQSAAQGGYQVCLWAPEPSEIEKSLKRIDADLTKMDQKGKLTESPQVVLRRIQTTTEIGDAAGADLIIETVVEKLEIKSEIFKILDQHTPPHAVLASNTSTIPISKLAALVRQPGRVVGIHFTSPVPRMPVAEVIRTIATSDETYKKATAFIQTLGKEPIQVNVDLAGFVFNRINLPSNVEAIKLVERGVASVEDIDKAMRLGFGRPMGPFETADMVGLDTGYYALLSMYEETKDPKFFPPELLGRKVWLGHLGRKVGKGWYRYDSKGQMMGVMKI